MAFSSPAIDYVESSLDLNHYIINHPAATYFLKMNSDSMIRAGILKGDVLAVDKALSPTNNQVIVAELNGELAVKRLKYKCGKAYLFSEGKEESKVIVTNNDSMIIWGVVTTVIRKLQ